MNKLVTPSVKLKNQKWTINNAFKITKNPNVACYTWFEASLIFPHPKSEWNLSPAHVDSLYNGDGRIKILDKVWDISAIEHFGDYSFVTQRDKVVYWMKINWDRHSQIMKTWTVKDNKTHCNILAYISIFFLNYTYTCRWDHSRHDYLSLMVALKVQYVWHE